MTKAERLSAARRKKKADPGQQSKTGAAKPTYVSTDKPKKKMKESKEMNENFMKDKSYVQRYKKAGGYLNTPARKKADAEHAKNNPKRKPFEPIKRGTMVGNKLNDEVQYEAKDKKGKGSGTKDACYHKVKSRYSVWPSAYASGALVKCRKVGAANWGNKSEETEMNVDEAMSSYDRNRKAAAKRAAQRNAERRAGTRGGRMERETYRSESGVQMHHKGYRANANEAIEYTGPKKGDLKGYGSKEFKEYEKNMDPKKRQALKDKATKGMKFTHEGTSYGLYKGSGKASGAMRKYLDNAKKMQDADKKKKKTGNPAFDDPSHHSNAKNRTEEFIDERRGSSPEVLTQNRENFVSNVKNKVSNIKDKIKKDGLIKFTDPKKRREALGNKDYSIKKLSPKIDLGLTKDVDLTKDGPGAVVKQIGKDKVVTPIVNKATAGIKGAISSAGKALGSDIGKAALGGAAILGTAALASKALSRKKEEPKKQEKLKPAGMREQVSFQQFQEKCWDGYEKKGMKTMFGKRYPNCVKKKK
jgi:hypothetical protein